MTLHNKIRRLNSSKLVYWLVFSMLIVGLYKNRMNCYNVSFNNISFYAWKRLAKSESNWIESRKYLFILFKISNIILSDVHLLTIWHLFFCTFYARKLSFPLKNVNFKRTFLVSLGFIPAHLEIMMIYISH